MFTRTAEKGGGLKPPHHGPELVSTGVKAACRSALGGEFESHQVHVLTEEQIGRIYEILRAPKGNRMSYSEALEAIVSLTEDQEKDLDEAAKKFAKTLGGK